MNKLSIFVDESGDFGPYEPHAPFYIFTLVFHDQSHSIASQLEYLEGSLINYGLQPGHCFHAGPIIRREEDYQFASITERRKILNRIVSFARKTDFTYTTFSIEKKHVNDPLTMTISLSKQLSAFINDNYDFFTRFERIVLYYDNGQVELGKLLATVFSVLLPQTEFRKVLPVNYRMFQVADLVCTLELISMKNLNNMLSKSESAFFGSIRDLKKNYLKPLEKKKFQ